MSQITIGAVQHTQQTHHSDTFTPDTIMVQSLRIADLPRLSNGVSSCACLLITTSANSAVKPRKQQTLAYVLHLHLSVAALLERGLSLFSDACAITKGSTRLEAVQHTPQVGCTEATQHVIGQQTKAPHLPYVCSMPVLLAWRDTPAAASGAAPQKRSCAPYSTGPVRRSDAAAMQGHWCMLATIKSARPQQFASGCAGCGEMRLRLHRHHLQQDT